MKRWLVVLLLGLAACADGSRGSSESRLVVASDGNGIEVGRWCSDGPVRSGYGSAWHFRDRETQLNMTIKAPIVLVIRNSPECRS